MYVRTVVCVEKMAAVGCMVLSCEPAVRDECYSIDWSFTGLLVGVTVQTLCPGEKLTGLIMFCTFLGAAPYIILN